MNNDDPNFDLNISKKYGITNWKCFMVGHSFEENLNDSGYGICDRCLMHSYYDNDREIRGWPRMDNYPIWMPLFNRTIRLSVYIRSRFFQLKKYLFYKEICHECKQASFHRHWKNGMCPKCGYMEDLPF